MKKFGRFMRSKKGTILLFAAAVALLAFSSIGGARAALVYSATYSSRVQMFDIGVALVENDREVSERTYDGEAADGTWAGDQQSGALLTGMLDPDGDGQPEEKLELGRAYPEKLQVKNTGAINEYVRVTIYKYWVKDGEKAPDLSPELIDLHLLTDGGWSIDEGSSTEERTVLYYDSLLYAGEGEDAVTEPFSDTITIDGKVADLVDQRTETTTDGYTTVTTTYTYDGARFVLKAQVDAVQEHNAADAVWSAWGRRAEVKDGSLRLTD